MLVIGLTTLTSFTPISNNPTNTEVCYNDFYPNTRYYTDYNVSDKLSGGIYYYAEWTWYDSYTTAYALNRHTCNMDVISVHSYCKFRWVAY